MMKKFVAVAAFAFAMAFAFSAVAANWDFGSTTIRRGSTGTYAMNVQKALNACNNAGLVEDGNFGRLSEAAAKAFQASKGLSADGLVGNNTKNALNNCGAVSTTPGSVALCPNGMTLASNCTMAPSSTTMPSSSAEGYLADFALDSSNRVTTVYESEMDKVVGGFRTTARLADQRVERVQVQFDMAGSGSANLAKYASSVSLWNGSSKIATMAIADASRNTSNDVYTFNFTGLSSVVAKDQIGRFYVSVAANGSIDSNDAGADWEIYFPTGAVRATSPNGVYQTYDVAGQGSASSNLSGKAYSFDFGKFSTSGIKATVGLSSSNPAANTFAVNSTTTNTNGVELLRFTIKATNSDLQLRKIPIQISSGSENVADVINTVYLKSGSTTIDSVDGGSECELSGGEVDGTDCSSISDGKNVGYLFSNLTTTTITSGSTMEFSVVVDLKGQDSGTNYSDGETLVVSFKNADVIEADNFSVQDTNGDQLSESSTVRIGSAVGNTMTLRVDGVNVVMGTPSYSQTTATSGDITSVTYTIPVTVTAYGNTLYIGQSAQLAATATASNAFGLVFQNSSAPTTSDVNGSASITLATSDATVETNGFRLDSGAAKHFTITVNFTTPTTAANSYRVALKQIRTFTDGGLTTGTNSSLLPVEKFQTDYKFINN